MTRKYIYLFLAVIGFILLYYFLISFVMAHGFDPRLFLKQLFGTPISTFFAGDLIVSSIVFIVYLGQEGTRLSMKHRWIYLSALLTVGLSFALPLFLFVREARLESPSAK
jgi:uncharacterized protein DUF2834